MGSSRALVPQSKPQKLLADSSKAFSPVSYHSAPVMKKTKEDEESSGELSSHTFTDPTVFKAINYAPCSSGMSKRHSSARKRPPRAAPDPEEERSRVCRDKTYSVSQ